MTKKHSEKNPRRRGLKNKVKGLPMTMVSEWQRRNAKTMKMTDNLFFFYSKEEWRTFTVSTIYISRCNGMVLAHRCGFNEMPGTWFMATLILTSKCWGHAISINCNSANSQRTIKMFGLLRTDPRLNVYRLWLFDTNVWILFPHCCTTIFSTGT